MKLTQLTVTLAASLVLLSCGNKTDQLQRQVDSLQTALQQRDSDYASLHEFVTIVSDGLDSIQAQEDGIFRRNPESPLPDRNQLKRSLSELKETLRLQREKISKLEKVLVNGRGDTKKLQTIIAALKQQIEQKDAQIADLMKQLEQSNLSVEQLTRKAAEQASQIAQQEEVMQAQDQALNEAFIRIGSKSELKADGLLSGGFLKKKKVNYDDIDLSVFQKIDIRQTTTISIPSKSPKLYTNAPADSYSLEKEGSNSTLVITDPTRFWAYSNILIIQTN
ncbi:MAG: hypothetical protein IKR31_07930 [Prevotella sp.]|nr:hypothetical protein [Prevotella sp.]